MRCYNVLLEMNLPSIISKWKLFSKTTRSTKYYGKRHKVFIII